MAGFRPEAEALNHARPVSLNQAVRMSEQPANHLDAGRLLQVDHKGTTASVGNAVTRIAPDAEVAGFRPVDADDLGAHVGQHHGAKRTGPDPGHLDDPVAGQWSHPALSCLPDPDGSFSKIQNEPLRSGAGAADHDAVISGFLFIREELVPVVRNTIDNGRQAAAADAFRKREAAADFVLEESAQDGLAAIGRPSVREN